MNDANKHTVITIDDFIKTIRRNNEEFNNDNHHDAHEFLIWLLDSIEQDTAYKMKQSGKVKNNLVRIL